MEAIGRGNMLDAMNRFAMLSISAVATLAACNGGSANGETVGSNDGGSSGIGLTGASTTGNADTTTDPTVGSVSNTGSSGESGPSDTTAAETGTPGCTSNDDCAGDPGGAVCNTDTGECVDCTVADDPCAEGNYCDPATNACIPGCIADDDCGGDLSCELATNMCVGCLEDVECPLGSVCDAGTCVPGCNKQQGCQKGLACCTEQCVDILIDEPNCGGCDSPCEPDNATGECVDGICTVPDGNCANGFEDCNGAANDGCEINGVCVCAPNQVYECYAGPAGTQDIGVCVAGTQTCNGDGTVLGPCIGQVLPGLEVCASGQDENCDGDVDEDPDLDADGWTQCGGDCCDDVGVGCLSPALVNPGAFEFGGNVVDDDCDGNIDNVLPGCDAGLASNSNDPNDYARAVDLCQFTTLNPPDPADRNWGVLSAGLFLANGAGVPATNSRAIRPGFGNVIVPELGSSIAVLSSGNAADSNDVNPPFAAFQNGTSTGTSSAFPADWFAANGNALPNVPGCPVPLGNTAQNPVMLNLQVRVPTNALSFSMRFYFFSAEYPEYVCTAFNDFFVALVDSTNNTNPADGNIAVYDDGATLWPVGVNILQAAPGLFTQCANGQISQCAAPVPYNGCVANNELAGTGFNTVANACGYNGAAGGGTGWLTVNGNVTPGEVMTLRLVIWDTSDQVWDSLVLLDDFQWSVEASEPGVMPG